MMKILVGRIRGAGKWTSLRVLSNMLAARPVKGKKEERNG